MVESFYEFSSPESSLIAGATYNDDTREMEVTLKAQSSRSKETVYTFAGVSREEWEQFSAAESKGAYFNRHIRSMFNGKLKT